MTGILRHDGRDWWIDHRYPHSQQPILLGVSWRVLSAQRTGPFAPDLAAGLQVTYRTPEWSAHAQGDYLRLRAAEAGERLPDQPIPAPKVRAGTSTRYYLGRWEKYTKRDGWVAA